METAARLKDIGEYYFSTKLREIESLNKEGKDIINLGIGSPDLPPHAHHRAGAHLRRRAAAGPASPHPVGHLACGQRHGLGTGTDDLAAGRRPAGGTPTGKRKRLIRARRRRAVQGPCFFPQARNPSIRPPGSLCCRRRCCCGCRAAAPGTPTHPRDLAIPQVFAYSYRSNGEEWRFTGSKGGVRLRVNPRPHTPAARRQRKAGIVLQPTPSFGPISGKAQSSSLRPCALGPRTVDFGPANRGSTESSAS